MFWLPSCYQAVVLALPSRYAPIDQDNTLTASVELPATPRLYGACRPSVAGKLHVVWTVLWFCNLSCLRQEFGIRPFLLMW